jgi:hypothetical protein
MRGQAALEYLMTYGWALIIVLVIVSILYATIFKPEFYIIEKCDTAPDLECVQDRIKLAITADGTNLFFDLVNSMGYDINIMNVTFYPEGLTGDAYSITCTSDRCTNCKCIGCSRNCKSNIEGPSMKNGETKKFGIYMYNVPADVGKMYKIKFVINYNITETGTVHKTAGVVNARANKE